MPAYKDDPIVVESLNKAKSADYGVKAANWANGVVAEGQEWCGVKGVSRSTTGGAGVWGEHLGSTGIGIFGRSHSVPGVPGRGVWGDCDNNVGVYGSSKTGTVCSVTAKRVPASREGARQTLAYRD